MARSQYFLPFGRGTGGNAGSCALSQGVALILYICLRRREPLPVAGEGLTLWPVPSGR
jgi:hypothetical protein